MEFDPNGFHISDGPGKPKDEGQVKALVRQIRPGSVGHNDLRVGYARPIDLSPDVFHGQRIDVQSEDASLLPHDFGSGNVEEPRPAAHLQHRLTRLEPSSVESLVGISEPAGLSSSVFSPWFVTSLRVV